MLCVADCAVCPATCGGVRGTLSGGGLATPELYGLPVASIDVPLPALEASMIYKDIVHAVQVPMEVPHLQ